MAPSSSLIPRPSPNLISLVNSKNSPGFQQEVPNDKGKATYMFWFTSNMVEEGGQIQDAGASTFYSAMSNINLKIEDGNPHAVALRTHFAQHRDWKEVRRLQNKILKSYESDFSKYLP